MMKRVSTILSALCITLLCICNWQALSQSNAQSDFQTQPQSFSEKPIVRSVQLAKDKGGSFPVVDLFENQVQSVSSIAKSEFAEAETLQRTVDDGTILGLNRSQTRNIIESDPEAITLALPTTKAGMIELELIKADIYSPDFTMVTSSSKNPVEYEKGVHYRGVVKGDSNSLAAISVFSNEVMGFYSTEEGGNVVLGRLGGKNPENRHILYSAKDLKADRPFVCGTKDDTEILPLSPVQSQAVDPNQRVDIYVEADFDVFQNKGSLLGVNNFVSGFFNQSATLYSNEGIRISFSKLFVWTSPSPYTGPSSSDVLNQFQSFRNSFEGDLGHLVTLRNFGGIAAGFDGFCNSNIDERQCISGVEPTYNNVPTYSWTVEVFTHEMGHLMGSRHTHACVWNGNGTAIDSCSGFTEGGCPLPGNPAGGGTIMSYCHLVPSVGINFSNGFGSQPGGFIRNRFNNASCLFPLYEGVLEAADCTSVSGYMWDKNSPNSPINVDIYINGTFKERLQANICRQDLLNAGKGNGCHGFQWNVPLSLKNGQALFVEVKLAGTNIQLSASGKTIRCGASLFPTPPGPVTSVSGAGQTWEQATRFSSSESGQITHIRYYKVCEETGTHKGRIWSDAGGPPLREVDFSESACNGWQVKALSSPLPITAGVKYRVSYNVNLYGGKIVSGLTSPYTNGPLTAWGGIYSTPMGTFPNTGSVSNFLADVVLNVPK